MVEKKELLLVIFRAEHIVIRCWQRDEMCEVEKRRWQEEGTHPVTTSETTANGDGALINSSRTHFHIHNEGKFVHRRHTARLIYPLSVTVMTFLFTRRRLVYWQMEKWFS